MRRSEVVGDLVRAAYEDPMVFLDIYCRTVAGSKYEPLGDVHEVIMRCLCAGHKRLLILVARDHLKSTCLRAWVVWMLWHQPNTTFLIISQKMDRAREAVKEIKTAIECIPFLRHLRGDVWQADSIIVRRTSTSSTPSVWATSLGTSVTGVHPDYALFDDPINFENVATPDRRAIPMRHYRDAESQVGSRGCIYGIGTRWGRDDLYQHWIDIGFETLTLPAVYQGRPLWPEKYSIEDLDGIRKRVGEAHYQMQYLLDPEPEGLRLFKDPVWIEEFNIPAGPKLLTVDMAYPRRPELRREGEPLNCAIGAVVSVVNAESWVPVDGFIRNDIDVNDAITEINALAKKHRCRVAGERIAEAQSFRFDAGKWLRLYPQGWDKPTRIAYLASAWNAGKVQLVEGSAIGLLLAEQARDYPGGLIDGLDSLAYAVRDGKALAGSESVGIPGIGTRATRVISADDMFKSIRR